jgi:saccharopepsin
MLLSTFLLLAPLVSAAGVHKLKLHKIPHATIDRASETQYLAEKYGAQSIHQQPLMGAGGAGRRIPCTRQRNGENLYWTQDAIQGGHGVPLSSMFCTRHHLQI